MPRPKKQYNLEIAEKVKEMRGNGVSITDIGLVIGMSEKTLTRLYRKELDSGRAIANCKIAGKLFELAMGGNIACLLFWAKCQMGWQEKKIEDKGPDIEALKKGIAAAFDSVGNGGQAYGVLVTPGLLSEEQWQAQADKYAQGRHEEK